MNVNFTRKIGIFDFNIIYNFLPFHIISFELVSRSTYMDMSLWKNPSISIDVFKYTNNRGIRFQLDLVYLSFTIDINLKAIYNNILCSSLWYHLYYKHTKKHKDELYRVREDVLKIRKQTIGW